MLWGVGLMLSTPFPLEVISTSENGYTESGGMRQAPTLHTMCVCLPTNSSDSALLIQSTLTPAPRAAGYIHVKQTTIHTYIPTSVQWSLPKKYFMVIFNHAVQVRWYFYLTPSETKVEPFKQGRKMDFKEICINNFPKMKRIPEREFANTGSLLRHRAPISIPTSKFSVFTVAWSFETGHPSKIRSLQHQPSLPSVSSQTDRSFLASQQSCDR